MSEIATTIRRRTPNRAAISRALAASLLLAVALLGQRAPAQRPKPTEYDIQATYLYNFAKFVRWPVGSPGATLDICVAGDTIYVDTLTRIVSGEQIDTHPLAVRAVLRPEDEAACSILFIDASAKDRMDSLLAESAGRPVLTVSDILGFLDRGGMIQFLLIDNRVRFAVDLRPVSRSGLSLSSELLKVAVKVSGEPRAGGAP